MEERSEEILAERRAKLARLRGELSVQDRDITSAPSLTVVDEFSEHFNSADARSGLVKQAEQTNSDKHKIFYADANSRREESDLEFNSLVKEAGQRGRAAPGFGSCSTFAEDTDLEDETDSSITSARSKSAGPIRQKQLDGVSNRLANQFQADHTLKLSSSITKVYENGKYISSTEDLGYQSSVSSPNESKRASGEGKGETGLLKVEKGMDAFSQSLPETFLKSVKSDLSQSVSSVNSRSKSKVVYDPRIFGTQGGGRREEEGTLAGRRGGEEDEVEREYFQRMNKFNGKDTDKNSFKQFLSDSFRPKTDRQANDRATSQFQVKNCK